MAESWNSGTRTAIKRNNKLISTATNQRKTTEILEAEFPMQSMPRVYSKDQGQGMRRS
jgi:hypothetical protein